ncbi:MAG: bifunctional adenosylcobinamide kinase/adenosylcobinamide-phosphate guanylyltransferase, partial [Oscillospiraceae bacterium]|nr:bifunctional adenosylcobinamide kinase/adenosylcobinamide-phosphate guanylyltransferase [Oscillospiraceae bacterium]
ALLLVVSNDIFSDGGGYPPETMAYIRSLGSLHQRLAPLAEEVVEIVCGLPVVWKQAPGGSNPDFFTPQG